MENKILFISYVFPPTGGAGIQRTVKLVKYFSRLGWKPHVLTAKNPSVPVFDYEMLKDIPEDVPIFKSSSLEIPYSLKRFLWRRTVSESPKPKASQEVAPQGRSFSKRILGFVKFLVHLLMLPDPQIGWNFFTLRKAKSIIRSRGIEYVFISAPPFSSLLLVPDLSRMGVKVVADFRDEWTEFYLKSYDFHQRDGYTTRKIESMERSVVEAANLVTMATGSFVRNYGEKYPEYADKIKLLTNGFDPEDFSDHQCEKASREQFNITYTGTIFNVTTARFLLKALERLFERDEKIRSRVVFNAVGRITDEEQGFFDRFSFPEQLALHGYVNHDESIAHLFNSELLIVIVDELDGSDRIIAAKIFEYIFSGIPILALVPEGGEIASIVRSTQTGVVVSNRDVGGIEEALSRFIGGNYSFSPDQEEIRKYSREVLAKGLIEDLEEL